MTERRTYITGSTCLRAAAAVAVVLAFGFLVDSPAYAFGPAADAVKTPVCQAFTAARKVLITAAVLAVIIGLAPMLWGQVKVKWVVSSLVVCVLFSVIPAMVQAFAGGVTGCGS